MIIDPSNQVPNPNTPTRLRLLVQVTAQLATVALLYGCASLTNLTAPRVNLAGIESLPGEGLELRFMLKLRVQNPGDASLRYDGVWAVPG